MYFLLTGRETLGGLRPALLDSRPAACAPSLEQAPQLLWDRQSPTVQVLQVARGPGCQHSSTARVHSEPGQAVTNSSAKMGQGKKNKACAVEPGAQLTGAGPAPPQMPLKRCSLFALAAAAHAEHT